jgi:Mg-chelatase subunit ChlD
LLKLKLKAKGKSPGYYEKLAQDLDYNEIDELVKTAIKEKNLNEIRGLADLNQHAVADNLQEGKGFELVQQAAEKGSEFAPEFFFLLRGALKPYYKVLFKNLTKSVIFKESRKIAGRGLRGMHRVRTRYIPYRTELDVPKTILNLAGRPLEYMTIRDLAGFERLQKKKAVVLILDTSGSMYGHLIFNAALTTAVLSYHMRDNEYSIIIFNTDARVMKNMTERKDIELIIDEILETQASGFTNITAGLKNGFAELKRARSNTKSAILITDGNANRAVDELRIAASRFENLHVIAIPSEENDSNIATPGTKTCEALARLGKGLFIPVYRFKDIPRALQRLLLKI